MPVLILTLFILAAGARAEVVEITVLQLNDVYEIAALQEGTIAGLDRVAGLRRQLATEHPNLLTVLAGDFLSPSGLMNARVDGQRLRGAQMVSVLSTLGLDYAVLGNHEFDFGRDTLVRRIEESRFDWLLGNVDLGELTPAAARRSKTDDVWVAHGEAASVKVGLLTVCLRPDGKESPIEGVRIAPVMDSARAQVQSLRARGAQLIIAITHLALDEDRELARSVPGIDLILGGHEHANDFRTWLPADLEGSTVRHPPPIFKADANAKTVYVHRLRFDTDAGDGMGALVELSSALQVVSNATPVDRTTQAVVREWGAAAAAALGGDLERIIAATPEVLDGRETEIRYRSTNLTRLVSRAILWQAEAAGSPVDIAFYNSGSVRIDDTIPAGRMSVYDVLRVLPFGGDILVSREKGADLRPLFERGLADERRGHGGFLHVMDAGGTTQTDVLAALEDDREYTVAFTDFLWASDVEGFGRQSPRPEGVGGIQQAFAAYLQQEFPIGASEAGAGTPANAGGHGFGGTEVALLAGRLAEIERRVDVALEDAADRRFEEVASRIAQVETRQPLATESRRAPLPWLLACLVACVFLSTTALLVSLRR